MRKLFRSIVWMIVQLRCVGYSQVWQETSLGSNVNCTIQCIKSFGDRFLSPSALCLNQNAKLQGYEYYTDSARPRLTHDLASRFRNFLVARSLQHRSAIVATIANMETTPRGMLESLIVDSDDKVCGTRSVLRALPPIYVLPRGCCITWVAFRVVAMCRSLRFWLTFARGLLHHCKPFP